MTIKPLYENLEIAFWHASIRLMSESRPFQLVLQEAFALIESKRWSRILAQALVCAGLGLILGFVTGFVRAIFW